jgi:DNA-binding MarR family transcriptional regulator
MDAPNDASPPAATTDDKRLVLGLLRASGAVERRLDRILSHTRGISFSEYQLVRELALTHGGAAARVDLAASVGLTPSAVTRALKPLEKLGYVTTERSDRDSRRAIAQLTPAGRELLADAELAVDDGIDALGLPATGPDDLNHHLLTLLDRLADLR